MGVSLFMCAWCKTGYILGLSIENFSMMGADYLFVSVKGSHTRCQEKEQLNLVTVDVKKLFPPSRNGTGWLNTSRNSFASPSACFCLQTFRVILIPHDLQSADMM